MAERSLQPESTDSTTQPGLQPESGIVIFPLRFDEYVFNHWYLFSIGLYLTLMTLGAILDIAYGFYFHHQAFYYFQYDFHNTYVYGDLTDWIYILGVVAVSLIALAFNKWRRSIYSRLQVLISKQRLRSIHTGGDVNQEYRRFLEEYQQALLSNKRYFLVVPMMIIFNGYTLWVVPLFFSYYMSRYDPLLGLLHFMRFVVGTPLATLLEGYFLATGTWVLGVTGAYVRNLALQFNFNIQPGHPDHCGGLRVLGDLSLGIALPILILAVLLGVYSISDLIHPTPGLLEPILADVLLFPFVLPLAVIAFFFPLLKIHQKMVAERDAEEDKFAERVAVLKDRIESLLDKEELEKAKAAKEKLELIQALYSNDNSYPIWPFDRGILLKFLAPQIVPVLSLIVQLGPVVDALKYIFRLS
jgi:hypothetical protein